MSVVIPVYNCGCYLAKAIESALNQTQPPSEIIVVDDGSTDNTSEVARSFGSRVRYICQTNAGPAAARNIGMATAHGDWIAFLDSDDLWFPYKLEHQTAVLNTLNRSALLCGAVTIFRDKPPYPPFIPKGDVYLTPFCSKQLLERNRIVTSTVLLPRNIAIRAGGFDPRYRGPEDWHFWLRLAATDLQILRSPTPLAAYRIVPHSLSQQVARMRDQELEIIEECLPSEHCEASGQLRRRAMACVHYRAAIGFKEDGNQTEAMKEIWTSIRIWPFPLSEYDEETHFLRGRMLARCLFPSAV